MLHNRGEAIEVALAALRRAVSEHAAQSRRRLPTVKSLSQSAGVASHTMWKAVQQLVSEGALTAAPRRGIALTGESAPSQPQSPARRKRWETVYDALRGDMARGAIRPGDMLAPPKQLVRAHGTTHKTLAKATAKLAAQGMLVRHGRTFRVPVLSVKQRGSRVVLIAFGIGEQIRLTTPRTQDHMRALEQACARAGVSLETCPYRALAEEFRASGQVRRFDSAADQVSVLGFLVWNVATPHDDLLLGVLRSLTRTGKPLAFLDENGWLREAPLPSDLSTVRTYRLAASMLCGQVVGRYLYSLGHRRVAALIRPGVSHAAQRAHGVTVAMRAAGVPGAVHIVGPRRSGSIAPPPVDIAISTGTGSAVDRKLNEGPLPMHVAEQRLMLTSAVQRELLRTSYAPLFEQALAVPQASAWVADNDAFALDALAFLSARGVRVPQDISVVGFDDSLEASFGRLTSYNFNGAATTDAMLAYVLSPGRASAQTHTPEIEGFISERATTAPRASG